MFQLIIGISLGLILLFVILLLITEVVATYPVWKHADKNISHPLTDQPLQKKPQSKGFKMFLFFAIGSLTLSLVGYVLATELDWQTGFTSLGTAKPQPAENSHIKQFSGTADGHSLRLRLQTKWEDGRIYGNNTVSLYKDSGWQFTDCRFHLLDKDGFLIKEILFSPNDFVFATDSAGRITGLANRFNAAISLREYQKIAGFQVVLDKKIVLTPEAGRTD